MHIALTLPRFLHTGFRPAQRSTRAVARPEQRTLVRHAVITLENRPLQLCVLRGFVWITRDGCPADFMLGAGEVFEQRPGAPVLVQALEDAELLIAGAGASAQNA